MEKQTPKNTARRSKKRRAGTKAPAKKATAPKSLKVYTYRMDERENEKANKACITKYKVSLSTFVRTLIVNHFPNAKVNIGKGTARRKQSRAK